MHTLEINARAQPGDPTCFVFHVVDMLRYAICDQVISCCVIQLLAFSGSGDAVCFYAGTT